MQTEFKIFKETVVPTSWLPNSVYYIKTAGSTHMEIYTTSSNGTPQRIINEADITAMIASGIQASNTLKIVATIAELVALNPTVTTAAYVTDATGDNTVASGGAYYLYNTVTSAWIKTGEAESMDVVINWAAIQNKPASTVAQIDQAVTDSHTHANKTSLDKIGQNANGHLTYDGQLPYTGWETTSW